MHFGLHVDYSLFLWDFNDIWIFSIDVPNILKYHISGKFIQWESSCSLPTDGQINMMKLTVAFCICAKAPKNIPQFHVMLTNIMHFSKLMFNSVLLVFYVFRTSMFIIRMTILYMQFYIICFSCNYASSLPDNEHRMLETCRRQRIIELKH